MLKYRLFFSFFLFQLTLFATVSMTQSAWGQEIAGRLSSGKALYEQNCAVCHGVKGNGKGIGGRGLTPPPANFTDPGFWKDKTDSFLTHVISNGIGQMPSWSDTMTPTQIRDVLSYIQTFRKE
ncbi:MAG: c-type cytochrome [Leptospirales bacterium]